MDIKSTLVGAGAVVLLVGGVFGASAMANADSPAPVVTVEPTIAVEKETPPVVVVPEPEPVVTPEPEPVVVPEPAPVVVAPAPAPAPEVVVTEPEPAPVQPQQTLPTAASVDPVTGAGNGDPANGDSRP